jgi:hypothetical protein
MTLFHPTSSIQSNGPGKGLPDFCVDEAITGYLGQPIHLGLAAANISGLALHTVGSATDPA